MLKKVYSAAAAFFYYSGQWLPDLSYVFENSIVLEARSDFFYRDNYKNEVDIIVPLDAPATGKRSRLVPVEVKFSDAVKPKVLKPIQLFMNRNKISTGIIITKNTEKEMISDDLRIRFIPGWKFALDKGKIFSQGDSFEQLKPGDQGPESKALGYSCQARKPWKNWKKQKESKKPLN